MRNLMNSFTEEEQTAFCCLLGSVDERMLDQSRYAHRYLCHLLRHKRYYVRIYARVLTLAFQASGDPEKAGLLVDYGSGNGLLGMFAAYCGVGRVILVDRDTEFAEAAVQVSKILGLDQVAQVTGGMEELASLLGRQKPGVIVGTDVIEHIYDLPLFFRQLRMLDPRMVSVFTTASNPRNPFKKRELRRIHYKDEYIGHSPVSGGLNDHNPSISFLEIRKSIIRARGLSDDISVNKLAALTRGMNRQDIEQAVDDFMKDASLPLTPKHPSNTCDPLSGSWSERLLELHEYEDIYSSNGFALTVLDGFYDDDKDFPLSVIAKLLNFLIPLTRGSLSPFIILVSGGGKH
jgi:hypothetical protein